MPLVLSLALSPNPPEATSSSRYRPVVPMAPAAVVVGALVSLSLFTSTLGQLVVLQPPELARKYDGGRVEGSTAAFGTPYYGERIAGNLLFFDKTGCDDGHYHFESTHPNPVPTAATDLGEPASRLLQGSSGHTSRGPDEGLRTVVMVRRGECHFVTKVLVAEKKGATAVIIVDSEGSMSQARDVKKIIMADDGWGDGVVIPSILIGEADGVLLIEELVKGKKVIVELAWDVPKASPVQMDQWLSPAFADTNLFLKEFAPYARTLKHKLDYHPHYVVITLPGDFKEMCTDSTGRFCGWDPDKGGKTTGKEIMEETVRQLCLWEVTQDLDTEDPESGFYSESWWQYVEQLPEKCPHKGNMKEDTEEAKRLGLSPEEYEKSHTLGKECSYRLMTDLGVNIVPVRKCYEHNFESLLTHELLNKAWSSTAVMINNWRYSGPLDAEQVGRTLCTGFKDRPEDCDALFHPSRLEMLREGVIVEKVEGLELWKVIIISCVAVLIGIVLAAILYWYLIHPKIRSTLRYSIMDEMRKDSHLPHPPPPPAASPYEAQPPLSFHDLSPDDPTAPPIKPGDSARAAPLGRQYDFGFENEKN